MQIRDFEPRDLAAVLALNLRAMDPGADPRQGARHYPELLNIPDHFQRDGAFLVGVAEGAIVAMAALRPENGMSHRVSFLRVAIDRQRGGLATRMMAAIEERARALGAQSLVLGTTVEQAAAQRLYESLGYVETHRSEFTGADGQVHQGVNFRKELAGAAAEPGPDVPGWQMTLLEECRVGHLATIAKDGRPHIVPVVYAVIDEGIAIAIDEKPKRPGKLARLRNIERDPRVTFLVDRYDDDWERLAWVRVEGTATVLERGGEHPQALSALRERYPQHREMALETLPLILIHPERVTGWAADPRV